MEFKKIDIERNSEVWNSYVSSDISENNICLALNPDFAKIFSLIYNLTPEYYIIYENNKISGLVPGFKNKNEYISMPVLSNGGIFLGKNITNHSSNYYDSFLKLISPKFQIKSYEYLTNYYFDQKTTCYLRLPNSSELLMNKFTTKLRTKIRRSYKNNLKVSNGENPLDDFYRLYSINMHRLGTPVNSVSYFENYIENYTAGNCKILSISLDGNIIGSAICFTYKSYFEVMWSATDRNYNNLNTNMVLYWEMMKCAISNNMKTFSFGRSDINSKTLKFKQQWGVQEFPLIYNYNSNRINVRNSKLTYFWKLLPYKISLILGPIIRKYIIN